MKYSHLNLICTSRLAFTMKKIFFPAYLVTFTKETFMENFIFCAVTGTTLHKPRCDRNQIRRKLRIWSHLLKKSFMENFIFCAVTGTTLHKKRSFPLRISSVNVTKSAENCGLGHIYQRNPLWKTSFFVL